MKQSISKSFWSILLLVLSLAVIQPWAEEDDDMEENAEETTESSVTEEGDDDAAVVDPPPRGQKGTVTIRSNPSKATVYLGGEEIGLTPIENLSFKSGRHDLTIMLRGEELVSTRFNVWPNKENVYEQKLVLPYGTVIVETTSKLKVYMDGEYISRTEGGPLTINNVEAGPHVVKLEKGKKHRQQEIEIAGEDTVVVKIKGM